MRFKFIGDHSDVHCGCVAVVEAIMQALPEGFVQDQDNYDVLIVNGEGSMHHDTGPCQRKMKEIYNAKQAGKSVYLINTVWQQNSPRFNETLSLIDGIFVREVDSRDDLWLRHGIASTVIPDLSLQAPVVASDFVDFGGRQIMTDFYSKEFMSFVRITDGFVRRTPYIDMKRMGWSEFVNSLKTASLLLTGRHHAVMAACKARTPFVALAGNTHKIEGFLRTANINIPVCKSPSEVANAIEWAKLNYAAYDDLFDWVASLSRWYFNYPFENIN